ncbi:hypothetical protein [Nocardiopsis alkaliphila]|mgnify:CR=1 FL=1|uniref:hypothetical protein n=1 Tax=Nocardiopsis alkaliphila TaxID=225762 RepID=UPI00034C4A19|nr:hypothetical protein [Nocardiopsis alkaliphila]
MRKHHTRWVALCSAVAISASGPVCLAGPASADTQDTRTFAWPMVSQGISSYSLDGYEITYLPPGLERYGINATSTTDGQGDRRSQLSWTQGPDQLYGRVGVLRTERLQGIDDLRENRYGHLPDSSLERLPESEVFEHGAYLAEESGDLFWVDEPGVALTTHLQPDRWDSAELMRLAESITKVTEQAPAHKTQPEGEAVGEAEEAPVEKHEDEAAEEGPAQEAPTIEAPVEEAPAEEASEAEKPAKEAPAEETPTEGEPAAQTPAEEPPVADPSAQEDSSEEVVPQEADSIETGEETPRSLGEETTGEEISAVEEGTTEAPREEDAGEDGAKDQTTVADKAEPAEGVPSQEIKVCLTEHLLGSGPDSSKLDHELMTPADEEFLAQALGQNDLGDDERDLLLATVWYYGHEDDKVAAVDDCAQRFGLERGEVEDVIGQVDGLISDLVQEADGAQADTTADAAEGESGDQVFEEVSTDVQDPIGEDEWGKLWDSLPWSVSTESP